MGGGFSSPTIEEWFCCLASAERAIMRNVLPTSALFDDSGIPLVVWDAMWLVAGVTDERRKDAFVYAYGLEYAEVNFPPDFEPTAAVVVSDPSFWLSIFFFLLTPPAACLDGCGDWNPP